MSQCVPNWDLDETHAPPRLSARSHSNNSTLPDVPILDYEVAELTWENGQPSLAMHGLGQPRVSLKHLPQALPASSTLPNNKYTWQDKIPRAAVAAATTTTGTGTLESIVNQATTAAAGGLPQLKLPPTPTFDDLVPWFDRPAAGMTMDALVPSAAADQRREQAMAAHLLNGSTAAPPPLQEGDVRKRARVAAAAVRVPVVGAAEWSGRDGHYSVSGSATVGRQGETASQQMTVETGEREAYNSMGCSQDNTSSGGDRPYTRATTTATADDHDSVCHSRSQREEEDKVKGNGKSSVSTKRSRAAAIHNQSERKRRDKINQRMKTLQKLVPNSSKTDKASVLDEVIEYLKQLQAQVQMMNRMNMQPMMLPMAMQQQLQMSMMAAGLGLTGMGGMGGMAGMAAAGVMDLNSGLPRPVLPGMPPTGLHPAAAAAAPFLQMGPPWDGSGGCNHVDRLHPASSANPAAMMADPLSTFLACQSQPMTLDAYSRMAAIYQQMHHQPPASSSDQLLLIFMAVSFI